MAQTPQITVVLDEDLYTPKSDVRDSPEMRSSICGRLFYVWATPMFKTTKKKNKVGEELEEEDLVAMPYLDETSYLLEKFDERWNKYVDSWPNGVPTSQKAARNALYYSLFGVIKWRFLLAVVIRFFNSTVQFLNPLVLNQFLLHIQQLFFSQVGFESSFSNASLTSNSTLDVTIVAPPAYEGYLWALALISSNMLNGLFETYYFWTISRCGWQVRSTMFSAVFRKSLALSASGLQTTSEGEILNYMQLDSTRMERFVIQATSLWDGLYQIIGYIIVIYLLIQDHVFVGLGVMLVAIPVNLVVFGIVALTYQRLAKLTDHRTKATNEAIQGILGVKMAAWENNFVKRIRNWRRKELVQLRRLLLLVALVIAIIFTLPTIGAVAAINSYANGNGLIDAATLFAVVSGFASLTFPFFQYPAALQTLANAVIGLRRLAKFLSSDETKQERRHHEEKLMDEPSKAIEIVDGEFWWYNPDDEQRNKEREEAKKKKKKKKNRKGADPEEGSEGEPGPVLEGINISIEPGELVAVVGKVGCGKSSLLSSMLGETYQSQGETTVFGKVAYSAQTAWIQNATIRENIVFGLPFDVDRYWTVIEACQLGQDLKNLPDKDGTIIGEKGINLSGGQKQRVSVARSAYAYTDIVLLDDPISALDPKVGRKVFKYCIGDFLAKRTRVMATNQLNFLPDCDKIIVLSNALEDENDEEEDGIGVGYIVESGSYDELMQQEGVLATLMNKFFEKGNADDNKKEKSEDERQKTNINDMQGSDETRELMQVEERAQGAVKFGQYAAYFAAGGGILIFILVALAALASSVSNFANTFVITIWTDNVNPDGSYKDGDLGFYSLLYTASAVLVAGVAFIRGLLFLVLTYNASKNMHEKIISSVMRAPMSFFDTTPTGRVMSRFTKDMSEIDLQIPRFLEFFMLTTFGFFVAVATILYTVIYFAIALPFLLFIYYRIVQYYRPVARDTKRLEAISRSPVYAYFSEAISGLPTIRAYNKVTVFSETNKIKVNNNVRGFYVNSAVQKWLQIRLRLLSALVTACACVLILLAVTYLGLSPGVAGLGLSFALQLTGTLGGLVQSFSQLEAGMNAVERINYYATEIEQEAAQTSDQPPPESWPDKGRVELINVEMRYRPDTELVLHGVSATINAGTRVGIVGRTGCGKSSLLKAMLRIVELESGSIVIDGINIADIGLNELRSKISIVPQNPTLFSGTIRSNLDPFSEHTDEEIMTALDLANLRPMVESMHGGIDAETAEYGSNLSQGSRQLLCMARALLSHSQILLLDEATSTLDYETDVSIQETIRNRFNRCTILAVAHRVQTIIDSDNIMVMDAGRVMEFDAPARLLQNPNSHFRGIVEEMPKEMADNLLRQAEQ